MLPRVAPASPPFAPEVQTWLDRVMPPGVPPLSLFATLARDSRLFQRFMAGGLLDRGNLTLRQRELVIDRVTARCRSEYEWGVHTALFAARVGMTEEQQRSLVLGGPNDPCWNEAEAALLALCDQLHDECTVTEAIWSAARGHYSEEALLEILLLCGFYRTVSYLTNALQLAPEPFAPRFPDAAQR